jgi:hypothetical protein
MDTGTLIRQGVEYTRGGIATQAYLAERTVEDMDGNVITKTYLKLADVNGGYVGMMEEQPEAGFHNSFYRGKDVTSYYTDGTLYTRISSGKFEDLYVGDYFTAKINGSNRVCRIAGFDVYWNTGDSGLTKHHAVIVPDASLMNAQMNETNTTEGGYTGSKMWTETIPTIDGYLTDTFGSHLLTLREYMSNAISADTANATCPQWKGAASAAGWFSTKSNLMTEVEVYGSTILTSSGYDIWTGRSQLPLFRLRPDHIQTRFAWWLRCVVSSAHFADVNTCGYATYYGASSSYGVRPRFIID